MSAPPSAPPPDIRQQSSCQPTHHAADSQSLLEACCRSPQRGQRYPDVRQPAPQSATHSGWSERGRCALTDPPALRGVEAPSGAAISLTADAFTFTLDSEPTENMANLKLVIMASAPQSNGVTRAYSKAVGIGTPKDPVSDEYDLKAEYDARHGAPSEAAPKVFMKWFFVDTVTGEVSGEQMALAQLTAATEPDAGA